MATSGAAVGGACDSHLAACRGASAVPGQVLPGTGHHAAGQRGGHQPAVPARKPAGHEPDDQPGRLGPLACWSLARTPRLSGKRRSWRICRALLPGPGGGRQVTSSPAGISEDGQQVGQPQAGPRILPLAYEGQGRPVTADRLAMLADSGVHQAEHAPCAGRTHRVVGLGAQLQGLAGVAARQIVVPPVSVAFPEGSEGPPLRRPVADRLPAGLSSTTACSHA